MAHALAEDRITVEGTGRRALTLAVVTWLSSIRSAHRENAAMKTKMAHMNFTTPAQAKTAVNQRAETCQWFRTAG
jgi:hypothetical protein